MLKTLLATTALAAALVAPVQANTIIVGTGGVVTDIPGLTGFQTTGAQMAGLQITACFSTNVCETRSWATTGPTAGGVTGTGWSLSVDGDTFTAGIWSFVADAGAIGGQLVSLLLDGRDAFTIFDRTTTVPDATGTPGSAQGRTFSTVEDVGDIIDVTYLDPTTVGGTLFANDLFQQVLIQFRDDDGPTGPRVSFNFSQDTDNDIRISQVPEPGSLALLAIAALGLGLSRRRR